jgi:hypothetical protein
LIEVKASRAATINFDDNFDHINLTDCSFETSLTIECNDDKPYSKRVSFDFDGVINGNYMVENVPTLSMDFRGINFGNIIFNRTPMKLLEMDNFFNFGKLFFNSLPLDKQYRMLRIFDSNIGNTEFQNIDFRKFNEVVITLSDVSSLVLTNSPFPKKITTATVADRFDYKVKEHEKIDDNIYFRETYRQLKLAMDKIGNRHYALRYKSQEMRYQRKHLRWGWDKLLLTVNYLSNNHGISWPQGVVFTVACALLAFFALNGVSAHPIFEWHFFGQWEETRAAFKLGLDSFLSFISTFPKLESSMRAGGGWKTDLVILLARIFIGIGIYQTVVAFRKYAK